MPNQKFTITLITTLIVCLGISLSTFTWSTQATQTTLPTIEWKATFGLGYYNTAHQIIQTQDGGYVVSGMYGSQNPLYVTFVKFDANGNIQWNHSYSGLQFINFPLNTALIQTNDSGYAIIGNQYSTLTLTLIKTNSNGETQWNQTYPGKYLTYGMIQTRDEGYLITGSTSIMSKETFPQAVLIKTDASGNMQWAKTYGTDCHYFQSVVQADDGHYVAVGGDRLIKVDLSGNVLWDKELPPILPSDPEVYQNSANSICSIIKTADDGYALSGRTINTKNNGSGTIFALIIKTDSSGTIQWNKTYGESEQIWPYALVQTSDNGYALAGTADNDMLLIRTDEGGNEQWTQTFGTGQNDEIAFSVVETSDGGFALAGKTKETQTFSSGYFYIIKTTPTASTLDSPSTIPSTQTGIDSNQLALIGVLTALIVALALLALIKRHRKQ